MELLKKVEMSNFMCFRDKMSIELNQSTYLFGVNNAGKTAVLLALRYFFDETIFRNESFLNKTVFTSKGAGYNKARIAIEFNLDSIITKSLRQRLTKKHGTILRVTKIFTFKEITKTIAVDYEIEGIRHSIENLDPDIKKVLQSVHITYLHPQEGVGLLEKAEIKLKDRLLLNWGRRGSMTESLEKLKGAWLKLREQANIYLSRSLTTSLQDVWSGSTAKINLPKTIDEIISISDISFQGDKTLPEIQLTSQGTGAQALVLYLTHFLLDSDRSLHRGEYNPVWLLEEPESFLHADLAFKLGRQLNSEIWLGNIQMVISTHSPIILATSRIAQERVFWNLLDSHTVTKAKLLTDWSENEIKEIGKYMGDSNFYIYFLASAEEDLVFIEDKKEITIAAFEKSGVHITKALGGTGEIQKYLVTLAEIQPVLTKQVFFILDHDRGINDFSRFLKPSIQTEIGFEKYKISDGVFLVTLPEGFSVEDLFDEFDNFLEECASKIFCIKDGHYKFVDLLPKDFIRSCADLKGKNMPTDLITAKIKLKNQQEIKDLFWDKVKKSQLQISSNNAAALKKILGIKK